MAYKVTISDGTILEKSIESVTFKADTPPDPYCMRTYTINSMQITGRIGAGEKTISLYEWSLLPANNPNCYKEIVVEQTHADQTVRIVKFSKAFVVDYLESYSKGTGVGYFSIFIRQLADVDIELKNEVTQQAVMTELSNEVEELSSPLVQNVGIIAASSNVKNSRPSFTDIIAKKNAMQDNESSVNPEHAQIVQNRIQDMINNMNEGEKNRTTYGSSLVKLKDGTQEMWVSAAGKKGYVPPRIRGNDKVIINKVEDANDINRFNDAEQTMMREADAQKAEILALGATRDMCDACQNAAKSRGILNKVVTPLKKLK